MSMMALSERERELVVNAVLSYRDMLASQMGQQTYGGDRDYYRILGYKQDIPVEDYHTRYQRNDVAARIVDLPGQDTWRKPPQISVNGSTDAAFVTAWETLVKRLKVWSILSRLDRLAGIGHYGVLLLGLRGGELESPVSEGAELGEKGLVYLRPLAELSAEIKEWDDDPASVRYGRPTMYEVNLGRDKTFRVHHSRVIHVADNKLDNEVLGTPRLQKVWNRLDDLMKLVGGAAEATWLNMRRGTVFTTQEGFKLAGDDDAVEERQEMIQQYVHDIARVLTLEGLEVTDLGSGTVDPRGAFEVTVALISAATNIPQRVLIGSAQGELAAAEQDTKIWYDYVASRQTTWAEPEVLRPFIDRLIQYGVLPAPEGGEYEVGEIDEDGRRTWPSLWQVNEVERAAISMNRGQAVAAMRNPVTGDFPARDSELRAIVGLPREYPDPTEEDKEAEREAEVAPPPRGEFPPPEPPDEEGEAEEAEMPEAGPEPSQNMRQALANYEAGKISATQLAQYAALQLSEVERAR